MAADRFLVSFFYKMLNEEVEKKDDIFRMLSYMARVGRAVDKEELSKELKMDPATVNNYTMVVRDIYPLADGVEGFGGMLLINDNGKALLETYVHEGRLDDGKTL